MSHLDDDGNPCMVDVGAKQVTRREASAEACVVFPKAAADALHARGWRTGKGAVIEVAVVAGILAAKRTHELIPFCHPLPIEHVSITHDWPRADTLRLRCAVAAMAKTGVEMEALVGVQVAATTVYDMCKSLSHAIRIEQVRVIAKSGGRDDFDHRARN